jgi:hypothetical protein
MHQSHYFTALLIISGFKSPLHNLPVKSNLVRKISVSAANPSNLSLWVMDFRGVKETGQEYVIQTWYYDTKAKRQKELNWIQAQFSFIPIEYTTSSSDETPMADSAYSQRPYKS